MADWCRTAVSTGAFNVMELVLIIIGSAGSRRVQRRDRERRRGRKARGVGQGLEPPPHGESVAALARSWGKAFVSEPSSLSS
jgi:hypothetical protein